MKLTKIRLAGPSNVDLPFESAVMEGPFAFKGADGLGPSEVDVSIGTTLHEGGYYKGRRPQNKEIVFLVGLQPEWNIGQTPAELRTTLYGLLTPKFNNPIKVQLMNGAVVVAQIEGYVKKMEISAFSKDPEVQVTVACMQPYFEAPVMMYQTPTTTVSGGITTMTILNPGTAPSGFVLAIEFTATHAGTLQLMDAASLAGEKMSINGGFVAGDRLTVNTKPGLRGVYKIPAGSSISQSILGSLTPDSVWLQLHGGDNQLRLNNVAFSWYLGPFGHTPMYWGV